MSTKRNHHNQMNDKNFWSARLAQAFLMALCALVFLPALWSLFFLLFAGWLKTLAFSITTTLFVTFQIYPRSLVTACLIALLLAFRSATWGSVSLRFTLFGGMAAALIFDAILRLLNLFFAQMMSNHGFGNEPFLYCQLAWLAACLVLWLMLQFCGLISRYAPSERNRLYHALKAVLVYAIYAPIITSIFILYFVVGDNLVLLAAKGAVMGQITTATLLMSALIVVMLIRRLRLVGSISLLWLVSMTLMIALCFFLLEYVSTSKVEWQNIWFAQLKSALATTIFLSVFCGFLLWLLGVPFDAKAFSSALKPDPAVFKGNVLKFGATLLIVSLLVAPPIWQCCTILWRALLFGLPPASYFTANISIAYIQSGVLFALPLCIFGILKNRVGFGAFLGSALVACFAGSFYASSYLGVSFGRFYDSLGWGMLVLTPAAIMSWYVVSCLPQIKRMT